MQRTSSVFASTLAAVVAAVALQAPAVAGPQSSDSPMAQSQQDGKRGYRHHGKHDRMGYANVGLVVPGYGVIGQKAIDDLALTDTQKQLVQQARDAQKELWSSHRTDMQSQRAARVAALKDGKLDPRAALAAMNERRAKMIQSRDAMTEKWLAVWDSLDETQRGKVSAYLSERADRRSDRNADKKSAD